ncbi:hypothetical protein [Amnibacterium endophyticum]|uniref:Uncharacterized protein n=1 Tax=Amnibacterium endophyticum TaxID=2109337 RepID=A0ABW4LCS6_9MICO
MAGGERARQVDLAVELEETARALVRATRDVPTPADSRQLLAELGRAVDQLQQTARQLSAWHTRVVDGDHYFGEDEPGDGATGTIEAAEHLEAAAAALDLAGEALLAARAANGVVRWRAGPTGRPPA